MVPGSFSCTLKLALDAPTLVAVGNALANTGGVASVTSLSDVAARCGGAINARVGWSHHEMRSIDGESARIPWHRSALVHAHMTLCTRQLAAPHTTRMLHHTLAILCCAHEAPR